MAPIAPRRPSIAAWACLLASAAFFSCSSSHAPYFNQFRPSRANLREHYAEHRYQLDQIEGTWTWEPRAGFEEEMAIIRDTTIAGYDFVALQVPRSARSYASDHNREDRAIIFAFRKTDADTLYEFRYTDPLRRLMPNETVEGTVVVKHDHLWFPGARRDTSDFYERDSRRTWAKRYP